MDFLLDVSKAEEVFTLSLDKNGFDLTNLPKMEVRIAVDRSGSMQEEFSAGFHEFMIDLMMIAGMKFDDNGSIDIGFFNSGFKEFPSATVKDFGKYIEKNPVEAFGGTAFLPVFENFYGMASPGGLLSSVTSFFSKSKQTADRAFLSIITDGDSSRSDIADVKRFLSSAPKNTFVYFIAIGTQVTLATLEELKNSFSNVTFIHYPDPYKITTEQFYEDIASCNKFKDWLK